jgi:mitogen-activated protein kinase 1/3
LNLIDFPALPGIEFRDMFLVLPYLPLDLNKVIQSSQPLSEKHVQVITCQIVRALVYLHAVGVAHRDLKPANILLSVDCLVKVCDFGLARGDMFSQDEDRLDGQQDGVELTEYVVTRWYRAPEVMLLPKGYTSTVDLWSLGCILGEMLGRKAMFPGKNYVDMIMRIGETLGMPSEKELQWLPKSSLGYRFIHMVCKQNMRMNLHKLYPGASESCIGFLRGLLTWDPADRLTAAEAQEHLYLLKFRPEEGAVQHEPFDWSFDDFDPTTDAVKERLYKECLRFNPDMLIRDKRDLIRRSLLRFSGQRSMNMTKGSEIGFSQSTLQPADAIRCQLQKMQAADERETTDVSCQPEGPRFENSSSELSSARSSKSSKLLSARPPAHDHSLHLQRVLAK